MNISKSYLNRLILCLFLSVFFELTFAQNSKIAKPSVVQEKWALTSQKSTVVKMKLKLSVAKFSI